MKPNKKANIMNTLTVSLIGLVGFVFIFLMLTLLISSIKQTTLVCGGATNASTTMYNGVCYTCYYNVTTGTAFSFNTTDSKCYESGVPTHYENSYEFASGAYNTTKTSQAAINIIPQFMQIIVIAVIFAGLLGLIVFGGIWGYGKMKGQ
jgi:hypothetical protein